VFTLTLLSAPGRHPDRRRRRRLVAKYSLRKLVATYGRTLWLVRYSLATIVLMLALAR